jgi:hypothetical protein
MFAKSVIPLLAQQIQAIIDLKRAFGKNTIIVLPYENEAPFNSKWNFNTFLREAKSRDLFDLTSTQEGTYLLFVTKHEAHQARSANDVSLEGYIDDVMKDFTKHVIYPTNNDWDTSLGIHQRLFYQFAARDEIIDFVESQNHLIADLNANLMQGYVQDYFAKRKLGSGFADLIAKYGIASEKRVFDYIDRNASYFRSMESSEDLLYAPEFGYSIGSDLEKVRAIISDIKEILNPFKDFKKLALSHGTEERNIFQFVCNNSRLFEDVKSVEPIFSMMRKAEQELQSPNSFVLTQQDMGSVLSLHLRTEYQIDINPTPLLRYFQWGLSDEKNKEYSEALKAKRDGQKPRVPFAVLDPARIQVANIMNEKISEIFAQETRRPKRGDMREGGGRKGLGPQLPNLWNPKEP